MHQSQFNYGFKEAQTKSRGFQNLDICFDFCLLCIHTVRFRFFDIHFDHKLD